VEVGASARYCLPLACTGRLVLDRLVRKLGEVSVCTTDYPKDVYVQYVFVYSLLFLKAHCSFFYFQQ